MVTDRRRSLGERGEQAVAAWYRDAGDRLLAANWHCREGELDLVLEGAGGETVVFCEAKTRTSSRFGTALDAVTQSKQRRLGAHLPRGAALHPPSAGRNQSRPLRRCRCRTGTCRSSRGRGVTGRDLSSSA